jgi:hypothetical protein
MRGEFACQGCQQKISTARFYPEILDITWKCKDCDTVSTVNIKKDRGY